MSENYLMKTVFEEDNMINESSDNYNDFQNTIIEDDSDENISDNSHYIQKTKDSQQSISPDDCNAQETILETDSDQNISHTDCNGVYEKRLPKNSSSNDTVIENNGNGDTEFENDEYFEFQDKKKFDPKSLIGQKIDSLMIESIIGEGGMGLVYLARHEKINKRFAVKSISPRLVTKKEEFKERLFQEAKIQALLEHPNIIQITNFIEHDSNFYLVMEFVEGESLEDLIKNKKRLNDDEAVKIVMDIVRGLTHAHDLDIIHRDIKPSNIMITKDGTAKIMDFGIAMMRDDAEVAKGTAGTIQYMSPEQISRPKEIDHRSDIYSIGILFYQMLTGKIPFEGKTEEIKRGHILCEPPPVSQFVPEIYPELNTIIMKAIEKDADDRFNDCSTFFHTLDDYLYKTHIECPKCNKLNRVENKHALTNEKCLYCGKKLKKSYFKMMSLLSFVSVLLILTIFTIHQFKVSHVLVKDTKKEGLLMITQLNKKQVLLSAIEKAKAIGRSGLIKKIEIQLAQVSKNIDDSCNRYNTILEDLNQLFNAFVEKAFEDNNNNNDQMIQIIYKHYQNYQSNFSEEKNLWISDFTSLTNKVN